MRNSLLWVPLGCAVLLLALAGSVCGDECSDTAKKALYGCALKSVDTNGDKRVTLEEMNAAISKHANIFESVAIGLFKSKIDESFHWCDKSRDFAITQEEFSNSACFSFVPCEVWKKVQYRMCPSAAAPAHSEL